MTGGHEKMGRLALLAAAVGAAALLLGACADPGNLPEKTSGGPAGATTTWTALTGSGGIFAANCQGCHGSSGNLSLASDQYAVLVTGGKASTEVPSLKLIDPGHSTSSYLYMKMTKAAGISNSGMPPAGQLSSSDTDEVGAWIDAGAPQ